jgi:hypothetical protein
MGMDGSCERMCIGKRKINLSRVFAGQRVGVREVSENIWLVSFMHYDLGFFDHETYRIESAVNPFEAVMRWPLTFWRWFFAHKPKPFAAPPGMGSQLSQGAYVVEGLGTAANVILRGRSRCR